MLHVTCYMLYNHRMKKGIEKQILKSLTLVMDPELNISVVDLGLIYDVKVTKKTAMIKMTLTTMGCPLLPLIQQMIKDKTLENPQINKVEIDLTFDPPWSIDMMTERGRAMLGI